MGFHRNDITIAIDRDGNVWAAQGRAQDALEELDLVDSECGLYYSQLPYRVAWRDDNGTLQLSTKTAARDSGDVINFGGGLRGMTGSPKLVGKL